MRKVHWVDIIYKSTHGGKRTGSGRPKGEPTVTIRIPKALVKQIKKTIRDWKKSR